MSYAMRKIGAGLLVVGILTFGWGCVSEEPADGSSGPDVGGDAVTADIADTGGTMENGSDTSSGEADGSEGETCVPKSKCPASACGQIQDGCGGTLDCGTCPCENGVAKEPRCGECGLGVRECGSNETGPGTCRGPDVPGVSADATTTECEDTLVFVDSTTSGGGLGTKEAPFSSYAKAVKEAEAGQTVVLASDKTYDEQLVAKAGVSVIGGFSPAPNFEYLDSKPAKFEVSAENGKPVKGLVAENIAQKTTIARVTVTTDDAEKNQNNYGAYVVDSSALTLRSVETQAGKGGAGADGTNGKDGADGNDGGDGTEESNNGIGFGKYLDNHGSNSNCQKADGGGGGVGGQVLEGNSGPIKNLPEDGEGSESGVAGGKAGEPGTTVTKRGEDGKNGRPGSDGRNGPAVPSGGKVENDRWVAQGKGTDGEDGAFGEGGGGGGGAWYTETCHASNPDHLDVIKAGPAGAGGGAGGCGGTGGTGGKPGRGSFGLFLVRSDIAIENSTFRADFGGKGGNGGTGGQGGRGGDGGAGTDFLDVKGCSRTSISYSSGNGGNGGDGGDGGHGAGGAGGVSYGAYCFKSSPDQTDVKFVAGGKANGGNSRGESGRAGLSKDAFNCQ